MPRPPRNAPAGDSLVGTLLALGLLLGMVTTGVALMTSTEGRTEPAADILFQAATFTHCPAGLRTAAEDPVTLRCATVPIMNQGEAAAIARCVLTDGRGIARFVLNGTHIWSNEMAPGVTEELPVRIEGARKPSLPAVTCASTPFPPG